MEVSPGGGHGKPTVSRAIVHRGLRPEALQQGVGQAPFAPASEAGIEALHHLAEDRTIPAAVGGRADPTSTIATGAGRRPEAAEAN